MLELRLVTGHVGNVSARVNGCIVITPSAVSYAVMRPGDLVRFDASTGAPVSPGLASREAQLHAAIYARRGDIGAVIHTHSPHATAWSFLGERLRPRLEDLAYYGVGELRTAPYAPPGSRELGVIAAETLGQGRATLLERHGVVAVGATAEDALTIAHVVEHQAHVALLLRATADTPRP